MQLFFILISTFLVSVVSLVGVLALTIRKELLAAIIFSLIAFSAGAMIGGAFLHLIPEALEESNHQPVFVFVTCGFILFFLLEKYLYWRHCHNGVCDVHTFTYLNLVGDALHNFIDGMVIAGSFIASIELGIFTSLLVVLHEIPQELGDFGVLVYGGFSRRKALLCNFISALTAFAGAISGYLLSNKFLGFSYILLSITAGGFIYIASSDLIPEIHKETNAKKSAISLILFFLGIFLISLLKK